uniref:(northern house mosquito) hypothetical protein n=1 Tax=Culex pipiens TaxID=7175 RepID=A0A8D8N021_CULPI
MAAGIVHVAVVVAVVVIALVNHQPVHAVLRFVVLRCRQQEAQLPHPSVRTRTTLPVVRRYVLQPAATPRHLLRMLLPVVGDNTLDVLDDALPAHLQLVVDVVLTLVAARIVVAVQEGRRLGGEAEPG